MNGTTDNAVAQSRSLSQAERQALFKRLHWAHLRRIQQELEDLSNASQKENFRSR